jgi:hypothetical protein
MVTDENAVAIEVTIHRKDQATFGALGSLGSEGD